MRVCVNFEYLNIFEERDDSDDDDDDEATKAICSILSVMEVIGPKHRVLFGIVMQMCYAVGFMLLSGLSFAIRNHQLLQVALGVLPIGLISLYW